jgi:uncharacterized protein YlxW (UPF0749 family)
MPDQRVTWLTRRPSLWSAAVPVVAIGAGALFATSAQTANGTDLRSSSTANLPQIIRDQTRENARSGTELRGLQQQIDQLSKAAAPGDVRLTQLTRRAEELSAQAGTQAVKGPTVRVALTDSSLPSDQLPEGFGVDDIVVHQQDVQAVVNALWEGGAEAMMLMDQRVISTSAVRCVGNTLILQGRVYSPPYVITAMGDPDDLRQALEQDEQVEIYRQYVDALGLGYEVSSKAEETFPPYAGSVKLERATAGS